MGVGSRGRQRARTLVRIGVLLTGLLLVAVPAAARLGSGAAQRPNVILITTDDQTVESLRVMTRTLQLLGAQGATFDDMVTTFPLCCPSRATMLTGQYNHNNNVVGNNLQNGMVRLDQRNTLPVWLQKAGYETSFIGKYLNELAVLSPRRVPPGWSDWHAGVQLAYYNHTMNDNGRIVKYGTKRSDYQTTVYTRTALDVIRRYSGKQKPFFLWLSYWAPHYGGPKEPGDPTEVKTPVPAPQDKGVFRDERLPTPPSFNEEDVSDKPAAIRNRGPLSRETIAAMRASYQQRLECLLAVDRGIAQVVAALKKRGVLDNTLILFTSDNGFLQGEHRVSDAKELLYEQSIRVPLLVRGPGVPAGRHYDQPVANLDLAPTIAAAAGAKPERIQDGESLLPLFADPGLRFGRDILLERGPAGASPVGPWTYQGIRTGRYVYAEYATGERELYDLATDPDELQSRHADPAYAGVAAELARRLALLRQCSGASCQTGPDLRVEPQLQGQCIRGATLAGRDLGHVDYVDYIADGRGLQRVLEPPFRLTAGVPATSTGTTPLRALAVLDDGRELTLDLSVKTC